MGIQKMGNWENWNMGIGKMGKWENGKMGIGKWEMGFGKKDLSTLKHSFAF